MRGALGFPVSTNPLSGTTFGAHMDPESVHPTTKLRSYAGSAYLEPARSRSNLTIWTDTLVEKVIFDHDDTGALIAAGVQYVQNDVRNTVKARKEVILSAGALHSPKILELSGIGNPEILQPLSVDVVVTNAHVGENLQNHLYLSVTSEVAKQEGFETLDGLLQGDPTGIAAAQEALAKGKCPLTGVNTTGSAQMTFPIFASEAGKYELDQLFQRSGEEPNLGTATPAFAKAHELFVRSVLPSTTQAPGLYTLFPGHMAFDENGELLPHPGDGLYLTFAIYLAHPLSRGSVHITSASPLCDPQINPKYFSHPVDIEVLSRHIQAVENIKRTEPLAPHFIQGGKRIPPEAFHFTCTCLQMLWEMGGVVDEKCRVYGCKDLRVCDLSIVPIAPQCNTRATTYSVAEHAAQIVKAHLSVK
ncbi:GMC oxidoreductase [Xylaria arbuscula]|nr:GMC oxidoreductase [Xylaria arbuscula]